MYFCYILCQHCLILGNFHLILRHGLSLGLMMEKFTVPSFLWSQKLVTVAYLAGRPFLSDHNAIMDRIWAISALPELTGWAHLSAWEDWRRPYWQYWGIAEDMAGRKEEEQKMGLGEIHSLASGLTVHTGVMSILNCRWFYTQLYLVFALFK